MPTKPEMFNQVINQLIKGRRFGFGKKNISKSDLERFTEDHEDKITWVLSRLSSRIVAAVPAVLIKGMIYYGIEDVDRFCSAITKLSFSGHDDPAHLLWRYLLVPRGKSATPEVYGKTVCAFKAYAEGRKVIRLLNVKRDIFNWNADLTLPKELIQNNELVNYKIMKQLVS